MKLLFLDAETFYSKDYSLKKMTPVEYVLDPRFEAIGCAVKWGVDGKPFWVDGPDLLDFFKSLDQTEICAGSHNYLFDGCMFAWRYGFIPRLMFDTLGMSRACLRHLLRSVSLASVMRHLGLGEKGDTVLRVEGMSREAIKFAGLYDQYVKYSLGDVDGCAGVFKRLVIEDKLFPMSELAIMDMVLRCTIEPRFVLDKNLLHEHLAEVKAQKELLLAQAMMVGADGKTSLMSNEQFAKLLRQYGVEPPTKTSPSTGLETYAFAKTDVDFLALAEHENTAIQVLVEARLGAKSTLEETRTQRFIDISNLDWSCAPVTPVGNMPMPISYAAAHTMRLGGDWKLNVQNMSRFNARKPGSGKLRRALTAPPGHKVIIVDASQIEAREVVYFSGQDDVVQQFARGEDTYASLATEVFGFKVNKHDHPNERFVGKQGRLGLGYQLWWPKFKTRLKTDSLNQIGTAIELSDDQAMNVVKTFRRLNDNVVQAWELLNTTGIEVLAHGGHMEWASCVFRKGEVLLPNGLRLYYHDMQSRHNAKTGRMEWSFSYAGERHHIYGGKLMENLMQALAGVNTFAAALRIQKRCKQDLGLSVSGLAQQAHDENVFIAPDEHVEAVKAICLEEMRRRPWWAPGLPLDAEVGVGQSYGEAK